MLFSLFLKKRKVTCIRLCACLILLPAGNGAGAQPAFRTIRTIPVQARLVTADETGNTYIVRADNTVLRYNERGDSTGFYRSTLNGDIGTIDATNPLRILLYYPDFSKVVLLDRVLSEIAQIDLRTLNIVAPTAVATASDGNLWVYDPFQAQLLKLDETGKEISSSNDLRQQLPFVPDPVFMLERDRRVYLCDTAKGILILDQFATYINTLPLTGIRQLQSFDQQLIYRKGDTLHSYNLKDFEDKKMILPVMQGNALTGAALSRNILSALYRNNLVLYAWPAR